VVVDEGCQDLRADADLLKGDYGMLLSVGAGRNTPQAIKTYGSSEEIVLSTFKRRLPAHSTRWCALLEMRGAIAERVLEFIDHLSGSIGRQTFKADGGTCDIAAQTLKSLALVGLVGYSSVK